MPFKILFICGTFELSKSGVADYIHCLALQLTKRGFQCACIALHDPYSSATHAAAHLQWQLHELPVKRLSSRLSWTVKTDLLKAEIQALNPDWISFHYVPYAYNLKGLPLGLLRGLGAVKSSAQWQIMTHELWVDPSSGLRNRLLSTLQQWIAVDDIRFVLLVPTLTTRGSWKSRIMYRKTPSTSTLTLASKAPISAPTNTDTDMGTGTDASAPTTTTAATATTTSGRLSFF